MTHCPSSIPDPYARVLSLRPARPSARSDIQAKAQPSLRAGAGGVGGLVAVSIGGDFYFPGYDNNGNVIGYWDEDGELVAEYAYDAFGNTIASSGTMADVFPHRFSTKYYDAETDLYYYGYRYYSPSLGRWISRDPIGEEDCMNLYLHCCNNSINTNDPFGLYRYITDFALIAGDDEWYHFWTRWHVGVSVDTWEKRKMGRGDCCWSWVWAGVKTFDFKMNYFDPLNYTILGGPLKTGKITETDNILVREPQRVMSTPEQDIKMLDMLANEKLHPKMYNLLTHNCIHWSWNALSYGMDAPMDSSSCYPKRVFFDSPHREIPLVSDQKWSILH